MLLAFVFQILPLIIEIRGKLTEVVFFREAHRYRLDDVVIQVSELIRVIQTVVVGVLGLGRRIKLRPLRIGW